MNVRPPILFFLPLLVIQAESQTFKGHHVGETVSEFLQAEAAIGALLADCKANPPKVLSDDEVLQKYGKKGFPKVQQAEATAAASGHHVLGYYSTDPEVYGDKCGALLDVATSGAGTIDGAGHQADNRFAQSLNKRKSDALQSSNLSGYSSIPYPMISFDFRSFTFVNGALDHFSFPVRASYDAIRDDVTQRVGAKPTVTMTPYQNGYGARWEDSTDIWTTDKIVVTLDMDNNPIKPEPPHITVGSVAYMQKLIERYKNRPKPLD